MRPLIERVDMAVLRRWLFIILLFSLVFMLYLWHLATLTPGISPSEQSTLRASQSVTHIVAQGVNTPYHLVLYLLTKLHLDTVLAIRLTSFFFGFTILLAGFALLRRWFGSSTGLLMTLTVAATPFLVIQARNATANIMYLWPIVIFAIFTLIAKAKKRAELLWLLGLPLIAIGIYTPGLLLILLPSIYFARRHFIESSQQITKVYLFFSFFLALLMLAPLIKAIISQPSIARDLMLVPKYWTGASEVISSIGWSFLSLFWHSRTHVDILVDKLPLLTILQTVLIIFGVYALWSRAKNAAYFLAGIIIFAIIAAGVNSNIYILGLGFAPIIVFMAAGLRFLLLEWRRVFPLNPIPNMLAVGLLVALVSIQVLYGIRYSLVAWPKTSETRVTYHIKP